MLYGYTDFLVMITYLLRFIDYTKYLAPARINIAYLNFLGQLYHNKASNCVRPDSKCKNSLAI